MGSPLFGRNVLEKIYEEYDVVLVVTQPDSYAKGGKVLIEQPVKIFAREHQIPIFQPEKIKQDYEMMKEYEYDFIVTAAYGQFIPQAVLDLPKITTLNVHGSMLPKYRGGAPIQRAIENGDEYLGVSVMQTILKMDAGCVYKQSEIKLEDSDTTDSMMDKLSRKGALDLIEIIDKMYESKDSVPYFNQDPNLVTFSYNIQKEEEKLDFNQDSKTLFNKIRAFYSNPLTHLVFKEQKYKVYSSKCVDIESDTLPGTIIDNKKNLIIKCGNGALEILEIQPAGKSKMDSKSFLNGYRNKFQINERVD